MSRSPSTFCGIARAATGVPGNEISALGLACLAGSIENIDPGFVQGPAPSDRWWKTNGHARRAKRREWITGPRAATRSKAVSWPRSTHREQWHSAELFVCRLPRNAARRPASYPPPSAASIQSAMLQDVDGSIVGQNGNFRAPVAIPNKIAQRQSPHLKRNAHVSVCGCLLSAL